MLFEFETNITELEKKKKYNLEEGFIKGNMFDAEYDSYKNFKPAKIITKNEREALLLKLMMLDFCVNDLNLYLAINPDDQEAYEEFKRYSLAYQQHLLEYEKKYQVLELTHDTYGKYTWGSNPWPWEDNYV